MPEVGFVKKRKRSRKSPGGGLFAVRCYSLEKNSELALMALGFELRAYLLSYLLSGTRATHPRRILKFLEMSLRKMNVSLCQRICRTIQ
jgi:hypothetical protein